jgi:hypothetical protein
VQKSFLKIYWGMSERVLCFAHGLQICGFRINQRLTDPYWRVKTCNLVELQPQISNQIPGVIHLYSYAGAAPLMTLKNSGIWNFYSGRSRGTSLTNWPNWYWSSKSLDKSVDHYGWIVLAKPFYQSCLAYFKLLFFWHKLKTINCRE